MTLSHWAKIKVKVKVIQIFSDFIKFKCFHDPESSDISMYKKFKNFKLYLFRTQGTAGGTYI
jgi:hypothetical protein